MRTISIAVLAFAIVNTSRADDAKKEKPRFTVSKKTTVVDGPLDADGRIDFPAAINAMLSKGITPEINANVLFWQAMGPRPSGHAAMSAEYFTALGVAAPPEKGEYFVNADAAGGLAESTLKDCAAKPWKKADHPDIAEWLAKNDSPLAKVVEGTKRSRFYNPLIPTKTNGESNSMISCLLPNVQQFRAFGQALALRAMRHLGEGDAAAAWEDLQACHRLARLAAQGGTLIEHLVGLALDMTACQADLALLQYSRPDAATLAKCMLDLRSLKPFPSLASRIQICERFIMLDTFMLVDRGGLKRLGLGGYDEPNPLADAMMKAIDWDPAMELSNKWYDRITTLVEIKDPQERAKQNADFVRDVKAMKAQAADGGGIAGLLLKGKPAGKELGKKVGEIFVSLMLPAIDKVSFAHDRMLQSNENVLTAFAMEQYKRDNKKYPEKLADLAPKYLKAEPKDLFSGKALIYKKTDDGYSFHSVGMNFRDDEGRAYQDTPAGDDLTVRMPAKN